MKLIVLFFFAARFYNPANGQSAPAKTVDVPSEITLHYFNFKNGDTCNTKKVILSDSLNSLSSCAGHVMVSNSTKEIERIRQLLTYDFIAELQQCCNDKGCPDTIDGYIFTLKRGARFEIQAIDIDYIQSGKCGSATLEEIIKLFHKIDRDNR